LRSIQNQSYSRIETIVVDNHSTDSTISIAKQFTNKVFTKGPERCTQRNFGAKQATGEYLVFIDSDMELNPDVIKQCLEVVSSDTRIKGVIIPEESFGEGFWADCKKLEKKFYLGVDWIEAPRFFETKAFWDIGGWNENMVSGEDWELSQRLKNKYMIKRTSSLIKHNEGKPKLISMLTKKYYYATKLGAYIQTGQQSDKDLQTGIWARMSLFLSRPRLLLKNPVVAIGMLFVKTCEAAVGLMALKQSGTKTILPGTK
jgi:glycosyltransferase involved in cell wall biosynthesis